MVRESKVQGQSNNSFHWLKKKEFKIEAESLFVQNVTVPYCMFTFQFS
jgi:hypothetical protein